MRGLSAACSSARRRPWSETVPTDRARSGGALRRVAAKVPDPESTGQKVVIRLTSLNPGSRLSSIGGSTNRNPGKCPSPTSSRTFRPTTFAPTASTTFSVGPSSEKDEIAPSAAAEPCGATSVTVSRAVTRMLGAQVVFASKPAGAPGAGRSRRNSYSSPSPTTNR